MYPSRKCERRKKDKEIEKWRWENREIEECILIGYLMNQG